MISGGCNTVGNKRGIDPKSADQASRYIKACPRNGKIFFLQNFVSPRSVPPGVPVGGVGWVPGIVSGIYGAYSEGPRLAKNLDNRYSEPTTHTYLYVTLPLQTKKVAIKN